MKFLTILTIFLLGLAFTAPELSAREKKQREGAGRAGTKSKAAAKKRDESAPKRSPMTGSKIDRPKSRDIPKRTTKPTQRPNAKPDKKPEPKPAARPANRPSVQKPINFKPNKKPDGERPDKKPDLERPNKKPGDNKPGDNKPNARPNERPDKDKPQANRPKPRPDNRPSLERPRKDKPTTLPGMVTYPDRPDKPKRPNRKRPGNGNKNDINSGNQGSGNRVTIDNSRDRDIHVDKVNVKRRNVALNRPASRPRDRANWDRERWGGKKSVWGKRFNNNDIDIDIEQNFQRSHNYSYRPDYWGSRPWWGAGQNHRWHHGHWNYGWNHRHQHHWRHDDDDDDDDHDFAKGVIWGIGVWSLGNMIYDMGYQTYRNPYTAPPVEYYSGGSKTTIIYAQPVSVAAAAIPSGNDQAAEIAEEKSDNALVKSRAAFKQEDYLSASTAVDEALAYSPGDVALHEYRALVFFSLGKYADAAGVLNSVLASGPGWGWDTMIDFYNGSEAYNEQLRKLENYVKGTPNRADAIFLLGYHYMVCGHLEKAYEHFSKAYELQPADSISRQLRDLTKSSIPDDGAEIEAEPPTPSAPVPVEKLVGTWVSDRGADGKVTFTMDEAGDYTWAFMNGGKATEMKGDYGLNDSGLLVLSNEDSQMVSEIEMKEESKLHFTLVGSPEGDPGLDFVKN